MGLICKKLMSHQGSNRRLDSDHSKSDSSSPSTTPFTKPRFLPSLASRKSTSSEVPSLQQVATASTLEDDYAAQLTPVDDLTPSGAYNNGGAGVLPKVPFGWEVRFDPTLGEYYYLNQINNLIQLDHPEEVLSPIVRHASLDSIFTSSKEDESDANFKLTKYGDHAVSNIYTDLALNNHMLLANGTGIPLQKKSWRKKLSLIKTKSLSRPSRSPSPLQHEQQLQQTEVHDDDDVSMVSASSSEVSVDRTAEYTFYGRSQPQQEEEEEEEEEEETLDQQQLESIRMRMLMEVKSCEMTKLATV